MGALSAFLEQFLLVYIIYLLQKHSTCPVITSRPNYLMSNKYCTLTKCGFLLAEKLKK